MTASTLPLVVDLDGTLLRTDTLVEGYFALAARDLRYLVLPFAWLTQGKANLKEQIASRLVPDAAHLPYHEGFLAWLKEQAAQGREIILATAANQRVAEAVAAHLRIFATIIASDATRNLSGARKREAIEAVLGGRPFAYAGNAREDLAIWSHAAEVIVVSPDAGVLGRAQALGKPLTHFAPENASLKAMFKALRPHQWLKNLLVFVPLLTGHAWSAWPNVQAALLAFIAFSLCASSVYLLNDLFDLPADRAHPRKRLRPLAAGLLQPLHGVFLAALLLLASALVAAAVSPAFLGMLGLYYATTLAYSLWLKRVTLVDVMVLAGLYTLRVIAGVVAVGLEHSFWLLAFAMFIFLSLALVKRSAELVQARDNGMNLPANRGYRVDDLPLLLALGTAAGYLAVLVLALYINSEQVRVLYRHPQILWGLCPVMLFWVSRMWIKTTRNAMHDDPLVFAIRDRGSLLAAVAMGGVTWLAL
jgi:4-hydroxybenzoate polyprenyltransferase/phosphoserine phosphatase